SAPPGINCVPKSGVTGWALKHLRKPLPFSPAKLLVFAALMLAFSGLQAMAAVGQKPASKHGSRNPRSAAQLSDKPVTIKDVRHWSSAEVTHVAIDLDGPVGYKFAHLIDPERVYFDLENVTLARGVLEDQLIDQDGFLTGIDVADTEGGATRITLGLDRPVEYSVNLVPDPYRLEITFHGATAQARKEKAPSPQVIAPVIASVDPPKVVGSSNSPGVELVQV